MRIQLIYMSAATRPIAEDELTDFLIKARQRHQRRDVTGMLVYHEGAFLQILEGEEQVIDRLYEQISQDKRHRNCALLLRSYLDHRSFPDWNMGFIDTKHEETKLLAGFTDLFNDNFQREAFLADPSISRIMLVMFRDGKWHQTLNCNHEIPAHV